MILALDVASVVLAAIVGWYLVTRLRLHGPIVDRQQRIAVSLRQADEAERRLEQVQREVSDLLEAARVHAEEIVARARSDAVAEAEEVAARGRQDAAALRDRARRDIAAERDRVMQELQAELARVVVEASGRVLRDAIDDETHRELIAQSLTTLPGSGGEE